MPAECRLVRRRVKTSQQLTEIGGCSASVCMPCVPRAGARPMNLFRSFRADEVKKAETHLVANGVSDLEVLVREPSATAYPIKG